MKATLFILSFIIWSYSAAAQKYALVTDSVQSCFPPIWVEVSPEFPGGMDSLYAFIRRNLVYPESARRDSIEGLVVAQFIVDTSGELINVEIVKGLRYDTDEEVLRMIGKMPKWIPGTMRGKKVRVRFSLPVRFEMNGRQ